MKRIFIALQILRVLVFVTALSAFIMGIVFGLRENVERSVGAAADRILGGTAELQLSYRFATTEERAFFEAIDSDFTEVAEFRSMLGHSYSEGVRSALASVRAVDGHYPRVGEVVLRPAIGMEAALRARDGVYGIALAPTLARQLGLTLGDRVTLGGVALEYRATIESEPDALASMNSFAPRVITRLEALQSGGLLGEGTLFTAGYRFGIDAAGIDRLNAARLDEFAGRGWVIRESRDLRENGSLRSLYWLLDFAGIVGAVAFALASLGLMISISHYISTQKRVIFTFHALGMSRAGIWLRVLRPVLIALLLSILAGLAAAWGVGLALGGYAGPFFGIELSPSGLVPVLWRIAAVIALTALAMFIFFMMRAFGRSGRPRWRDHILARLALLLTIALAASIFTTLFEGMRATGYIFAGILATFIIFMLGGFGLRAVLRWWSPVGGSFRLALAALASPRGELVTTTVALGTALFLIATLGQIARGLEATIPELASDDSPDYFLVDIQSGQRPALQDFTDSQQAITNFETAPMLRGVISAINGRPVSEFPDHWVFNGDRGVTISDTAPRDVNIVAGEWWQADETDTVMALDAEVARDLGLSLGDTMTVNILGRDIIARIETLIEVDFSTLEINFIMYFSGNTLAGAPFSYIATLNADRAGEAPFLLGLAEKFPNVVAISVASTLEHVRMIVAQARLLLIGISSVAMLSAFMIVAALAVVNLESRRYETTVLSTIGAPKWMVLRWFLWRSLSLGALVALFALALAGATGWAVMRFAFEIDAGVDITFLGATGLVVIGVYILVGAGFALFATYGGSDKLWQSLRRFADH